MLDELRPMGLYQAALTLEIEPFEVVRLLTLANAVPESNLLICDATLDLIKDVGGIEQWWTDSPDQPDELVRAAIGILLDRGHIGERSARIDNLWRGLPVESQSVLQQAVHQLVQGGFLATMMHLQGVHVTVAPEAVDRLRAVAAGELSLSSLSPLLG
ncbi:MAG: hypothetical protein JXX28_17170 [Deltaproteobacteria bacterium]|nr:hypothetical protein [Deltaproteobacteria bacterium]